MDTVWNYENHGSSFLIGGEFLCSFFYLCCSRRRSRRWCSVISSWLVPRYLVKCAIEYTPTPILLLRKESRTISTHFSLLIYSRRHFTKCFILRNQLYWKFVHLMMYHFDPQQNRRQTQFFLISLCWLVLKE